MGSPGGSVPSSLRKRTDERHVAQSLEGWTSRTSENHPAPHTLMLAFAVGLRCALHQNPSSLSVADGLLDPLQALVQVS